LYSPGKREHREQDYPEEEWSVLPLNYTPYLIDEKMMGFVVIGREVTEVR
jgi:hypothetical protein